MGYLIWIDPGVKISISSHVLITDFFHAVHAFFLGRDVIFSHIPKVKWHIDGHIAVG